MLVIGTPDEVVYIANAIARRGREQDGGQWQGQEQGRGCHEHDHRYAQGQVQGIIAEMAASGLASSPVSDTMPRTTSSTATAAGGYRASHSHFNVNARCGGRSERGGPRPFRRHRGVYWRPPTWRWQSSCDEEKEQEGREGREGRGGSTGGGRKCGGPDAGSGGAGGDGEGREDHEGGEVQECEGLPEGDEHHDGHEGEEDHECGGHDEGDGRHDSRDDEGERGCGDRDEGGEGHDGHEGEEEQDCGCRDEGGEVRGHEGHFEAHEGHREGHEGHRVDHEGHEGGHHEGGEGSSENFLGGVGSILEEVAREALGVLLRELEAARSRLDLLVAPVGGCEGCESSLYCFEGDVGLDLGDDGDLRGAIVQVGMCFTRFHFAALQFQAIAFESDGLDFVTYMAEDSPLLAEEYDGHNPYLESAYTSMHLLASILPFLADASSCELHEVQGALLDCAFAHHLGRRWAHELADGIMRAANGPVFLRVVEFYSHERAC